MERETLTIAEAAKILGCGRNTAYAMAKTGKLPCIMAGKKYLIPKQALNAMLSQLKPVKE